jgi:hypothetical protein
MTRTSDDLPEALDPTTPTALPAFSVKLTPCTTSFCAPGGATPNVSTVNACAGAGSSIRAAAAGIAANSWPSRCQLWRAATKPFQLAIARSIGAKARPARIEPAIMMPAVASCWMTR